MAPTYHITTEAYNSPRVVLCGQVTWGWCWSYVGWERDKRHSWCKKCLDLEPLAELSDTDL